MMRNPLSGIGQSLGQLPGFIFGEGTQAPSYEALQKKREIIDALQQQAAAAPLPQNHAEGVTNVARALFGRLGDARLSRKEDAERGRLNESMQSIIASLSGGGGPTMSSMGGGTPGFVPPGVGGAPASQPRADFQLPPGAGDFSQLFPQIEQEFRLPQGYLSRTAQIESGGDPSARNPNSSAKGLFQFIDSTAKQYGVNPMDPVSSTQGAARLAADNAAHLSRVLGREPSAAELYLAHQQGAGGAAKLLANPDARAVDIVGADAVRLNGGDASMSARDFAGLWLGKFEGGGGGSAGGYSGGGGSSGPNYEVIAQLGEMMGNPYMTEGQQAVAKALIEQQMGGGGMTEYQRAQLDMDRQRLALDRDKFASGTREGPKFYGNVQWAERPNPQTGEMEMVPYQIGSDGSVSYPDLGDGARPLPQTRSADLGTSIVAVGPGGTPVGNPLQKDVSGAAAQTEIGKSAGAAAAGLGERELNVQATIDQMNRIANDPALPSVLGNIQGRLPAMSQAGANLITQIDGLTSKAFANAIETLRGLGAMTDREGQAATQALANLSRIQDEEAFIAEMNRLSQMLSGKLEAARQKAAGAGGAPLPAEPAPAPAGGPQPGVTEDGYMFRGGDPSDPANWVKVQ